MAFDTYMVIDGGSVVAGEATAAGLTPATGWFELFSFSWGASNPTTVGTTGTGLSAGKVSVSSFNVMKKTENSSAPLFTACCSGQHFKNATVIMRKAAGTTNKQMPFLQYDFTDVMVESVQWSGSTGGDDTPTESVSFAFGKVTVGYTPQKSADGGPGKLNTGSWDLTAATTVAS